MVARGEVGRPGGCCCGGDDTSWAVRVSIMTCHGDKTPWIIGDSLCEPHFGAGWMEGRRRKLKRAWRRKGGAMQRRRGEVC